MRVYARLMASPTIFWHKKSFFELNDVFSRKNGEQKPESFISLRYML